MSEMIKLIPPIPDKLRIMHRQTNRNWYVCSCWASYLSPTYEITLLSSYT
jgi:hypothetical protein